MPQNQGTYLHLTAAAKRVAVCWNIRLLHNQFFFFFFFLSTAKCRLACHDAAVIVTFG